MSSILVHCAKCTTNTPIDENQLIKSHGLYTIKLPCGHTSWLHKIGPTNYIVMLDDPSEPKEAQTATTAAAICKKAAELVGGDRADTHGDMLLNFENIAAAWNAILDAKTRFAKEEHSPILNAYDAANMLEALKIMRRYSGKFNIDDHIDGAGYASCGGEIGEKMFNPKQQPET